MSTYGRGGSRERLRTFDTKINKRFWRIAGIRISILIELLVTSARQVNDRSRFAFPDTRRGNVYRAVLYVNYTCEMTKK